MADWCDNSKAPKQEEKPDCTLQPSSKYVEEESKRQSKLGTFNRCKIHEETKPPILCPECDGWKRYALYTIPLLFYLPWAIKKMRCSPKCCPPPTCCPKAKCPIMQNTCCEQQPTKWIENYQPKKQQDFRCGKEKKACQD